MRASLLIVVLAGCASETLDPLDVPPPEKEACTVSFRPPLFELGVVQRARVTSLGIQLENNGPVVCELTSMTLRDPETDFVLTPLRLPAQIGLGQRVSFGLDFTPLDVGPYSNAIVATMSGGERFELEISATSVEAMLLVVPNALRFDTRTECLATRRIHVFNTGTGPATFRPVLEGAGALSFVVDSPGDQTLQPGASVMLEVFFNPPEPGSYDATLTIDKTVVELSGVVRAGEQIVDTYRTEPRAKGDFLLVIDDSPWMIDAQAHLEANLELMVETARSTPYDLQFAITTTDMSPTGAQGRLLPLEAPRILPKEAQWDEWREILPGTNGSTHTRGLEAFTRALNMPLPNFPRADAHVGVIVISAVDDDSPGPVDSYLQPDIPVTLVGGGAEGCDRNNVSALPSPRYLEITENSGAAFHSFCSPDWGRSIWDEGLTDPRPFFVALSHIPRPDTIEVAVGGSRVPATSPSGQGIWSWNSTRNAIGFSAFATPEPDTDVVISYELGCE